MTKLHQPAHRIARRKVWPLHGPATGVHVMRAGVLMLSLAMGSAWTGIVQAQSTSVHADAAKPGRDANTAQANPASETPTPAAQTAPSAQHAPTLSVTEATDLLRAIEAQTAATIERPNPEAADPAPRSGTDHVNELLSNALSYIGVRYRYGGNTPEHGFDCSGLVRWVYNRTWGVMLPRRAAEIAKIGTEIPKDQLKPGDLVFFNTLRRTFSHVGIYLGNGQFLHAPSSGGKVRVEALDQAYWNKRWSGARRLNGAPVGAETPAATDAVAQTQAAPPSVH